MLACHVRQSFVPGEITPEEANRLGVEFAKRFTKGNHAFVVCTHIDKSHIHNHIIWNAVNLNCDRKFRNFWGSTRAVRRLNDTICVENGYSIVEDPKPHGKSYNKWLGDRAKPSHREQLRMMIDQALEQKPAVQTEPPKVNLLVDIQAKLQAGKGAGYARWAKVFNLKQMAQTMNYLTEHGLLEYAALEEKAAAVTTRHNELSAQIKAAETRMAEIAVLRTHIINYVKTREVYTAYRKAGYSKKFLAEREADILLHKAAKKAFDDLGIKKLPTVRSLQVEYAQLLEGKKKDYAEYRRSREEMRELLAAKANVDRLMGYGEERQNDREKEQGQDR